MTPWIMARASLKFFTVKFLGLKWPAHYGEWENIVTTQQRALFQSPRGSWKSWFFTIAYPLWNIINKKTEILLVSDAEGQAQKNLRELRLAIENSPFLEALLPSTKELWGTEAIQFKNGSYVSIMGFGTSKRGIHPDIIINDDIESERNKMSWEDKKRMYFGVITGMAMPHTRIFTVGTPLEFEDLLQQLEKNEAYTKWRRPAMINGVNQFPDLWTDEWLNLRRLEMGSIDFAREMLLERVDPTTQPFKRTYETVYDEAPERDRFMFVGTVCDPAYTEEDGDYTAIVTVGITHGNHAYVLSAERIRREDPGPVVDKLFSQIAAYKPDSVGIKRRKGDAIAFTFEERKVRENQWDFKYVPIADTRSKRDKSRIGGLVPRWEARTIHVHRHMADLLKEFYEFRLDDSHQNDDMVDAIADIFNPDMARPNTGKVFVPTPETSRIGRPLYRMGSQGSGDRGAGKILGVNSMRRYWKEKGRVAA